MTTVTVIPIVSEAGTGETGRLGLTELDWFFVLGIVSHAVAIILGRTTPH